MARFNPHRAVGPVLSAAARWAEACLVGDGSILAEGKALWTSANLDELDRLFVQNLDLSADKYLDKLQRQLSPGSPDAQRLMAEISWIVLLFQSNVLPPRKREVVCTIWDWSGQALDPQHPMLADPVLAGVGHPGLAYTSQGWREVVFLIGLAQTFKRLDAALRAALMTDAWRFTQWLDKVPQEGKRQLRHILPYLCFPDEFERIATDRDKRAIVVAFEDVSAQEVSRWKDEAVDRALLAVRQRLQAATCTRWRPMPAATVAGNSPCSIRVPAAPGPR